MYGVLYELNVTVYIVQKVVTGRWRVLHDNEERGVADYNAF